jgi:protein phosphatase
MAEVRLKFGAISVVGNYRENNEDRFHVDPQARFFLVADGMGGQCAGEKASELAVELISERLERNLPFDSNDESQIVSVIDQAVCFANTEIMALGELDPTYHNMGTTIAFIVGAGRVLYAGGVGDSRVYLLRQGKMEQLTKDHSLIQALLDAGTISPEEAATHRYRNVLYRYLGTKDGSAGTTPARIEPEAGDRFVVCSDGVTDGIKSDQIAKILAAESDPEQAAEAIVKAALDGGSKDNVTCIVVMAE